MAKYLHNASILTILINVNDKESKDNILVCMNQFSCPIFMLMQYPTTIAMSEGDFENLIDDYRKEAYTRVVEDFVSAFESCGFRSDELLYAISDAFQKRGLNKIATYLDDAGANVPLDSEANAQFRAIRLDEEENQ